LHASAHAYGDKQICITLFFRARIGATLRNRDVVAYENDNAAGYVEIEITEGQAHAAKHLDRRRSAQLGNLYRRVEHSLRFINWDLRSTSGGVITNEKARRPCRG